MQQNGFIVKLAALDASEIDIFLNKVGELEDIQ